MHSAPQLIEGDITPFEMTIARLGIKRLSGMKNPLIVKDLTLARFESKHELELRIGGEAEQGSMGPIERPDEVRGNIDRADQSRVNPGADDVAVVIGRDERSPIDDVPRFVNRGVRDRLSNEQFETIGVDLS